MTTKSMETLSNKELIIRLIRYNLINIKLTSGLNSLGLNANDYRLYLGDIIFLLMDFECGKHNDLMFENIYFAIGEKVKLIDFSSSMEQLDMLCQEMYDELLFAKKICSTEL